MEEEGERGGAETTEVLGEVMAAGETVAGAMAGDANADDAMVDDEADGTAMLALRMREVTEEAATTTGMRRRHKGKRINWQRKRGRRSSRPLPRPPLQPFESRVCTKEGQ